MKLLGITSILFVCTLCVLVEALPTGTKVDDDVYALVVQLETEDIQPSIKPYMRKVVANDANGSPSVVFVGQKQILDEIPGKRLLFQQASEQLWIATVHDNKCQFQDGIHSVEEYVEKMNLKLSFQLSSNEYLWEGDRGHEADGNCIDVFVLVDFPVQEHKATSISENYQGLSFIPTVTQAGNPVIHKLVSEVSEAELEKSVNHLSSIFSRQSYSEGAVTAQNWIASRYTDMGLNVKTHAFLPGYSSNVIAELPGMLEPDKVIIVSGHYDSRSTNSSDPSMRAPGADDNATGSSASLEAARVIMGNQQRFAYTIRFCAWSGEEQGLRGSAQYAKEMREKGEKILAVFNGDMLGYNAPGTNFTLGMKDLYVTPWLLSVVNTITSVYVPDLNIASSASCCSDHQSFFQNGFPAVGYFESRAGASDYPNYHKSTDTPDKVHFGLHRRITSAMLAAVATFAVPASE